MTYPPGGPGYPQPPQSQFSAPTQQFERVPEPAQPPALAHASATPSAAPSAPDAGPSKLPVYLGAAVAVLGFAIYLTSFGPVFGEFGSSAFELVVAPVVAALLAGVGLLPKQTDRSAIAAVFAVLGFLLLILVVVAGAPIDWAFYPFIVFSVLQSIAAVAVVLLDAGVITAPPPRPKYEQPAYGPGYGASGGYYGQPHGGPQQQGYPPQQYGGYQGGAPNTGGFQALGRPNGPPNGPGPQGGHFGNAPQGSQAQTTAWPTSGSQGGQQSGPPTPPTGFPAFGQPQAAPDSAAAPSLAKPEPDDAAHHTQVAPQQSAPPPS